MNNKNECFHYEYKGNCNGCYQENDTSCDNLYLDAQEYEEIITMSREEKLSESKPESELQNKIKETKERYSSRWGCGWMEEIEECFGDFPYVECESSSDYSGYREDFAMRDSQYNAWIRRLDKNKITYLELAGGYYTRIILAQVDENSEELLVDWFEQLEQYPIFDDDIDNDEYNELLDQYTVDNMAWEINRLLGFGEFSEQLGYDILDVLGDYEHFTNSEINAYQDRMSMCQYLDDDMLKMALKALGYTEFDELFYSLLEVICSYNSIKE